MTILRQKYFHLTKCMEVSNTLLGVQTCIMLLCGHMAKYNAAFFFSNWLGLLFSKRKTIAYFFAYINLIALSDLQCAKIHSEIISASGMLLAYS